MKIAFLFLLLISSRSFTQSDTNQWRLRADSLRLEFALETKTDGEAWKKLVALSEEYEQAKKEGVVDQLIIERLRAENVELRKLMLQYMKEINEMKMDTSLRR